MKKILLMALLAISVSAFSQTVPAHRQVRFYNNGAYAFPSGDIDYIVSNVVDIVDDTLATLYAPVLTYGQTVEITGVPYGIHGPGQYYWLECSLDESDTNEIELPSTAGHEGDVLAVVSGVTVWQDVSSPLVATDDLDFPNTSSLTTSERTIVVTGAAVGDIVSCSHPIEEGLFDAFVSDVDEVTIRYFSISGNDPAEATFNVMVFKQ